MPQPAQKGAFEHGGRLRGRGLSSLQGVDLAHDLVIVQFAGEIRHRQLIMEKRAISVAERIQADDPCDLLHFSGAVFAIHA